MITPRLGLPPRLLPPAAGRAGERGRLEVAVDGRQAVGMPLLGTLSGGLAPMFVVGRVIPQADDRFDPRLDILGRGKLAGLRRIFGRDIE